MPFDGRLSRSPTACCLSRTDPDTKHPKHAQILAVELSADATKVFAGGIDNCVQVWDLAKGGGEGPVDVYEGHADSITGLRLSPDGCVGSSVQ